MPTRAAFPLLAATTPGDGLTIYAAHRRDRVLGTAGRWLLDELRRRLTDGALAHVHHVQLIPDLGA
ncbi:hypothetical protein F0U61_07135 [Archangium violaceum]|nr:hypothetical protein F0U61_07135 [Archangium violaceum]